MNYNASIFSEDNPVNLDIMAMVIPPAFMLLANAGKPMEI